MSIEEELGASSNNEINTNMDKAKVENSKHPEANKIQEPKGKTITTIPIKAAKKRWVIPLVILVLLLGLGIGGYFAYDTLQQYILERELEAFQIGTQYGYKSGLLEIYDKAITCQPIQVTKEGITINLLDTRCLSR